LDCLAESDFFFPPFLCAVIQSKNNYGTIKNNSNFMRTNQNKFRVHPAAIRLLTDATWEFAHNMLWNGYPFSKSEIALAKIYIREYYEEIPAEEFTATAHKHFSAYCERILLAKEYVSRFAHRYIPHPCLWFDKRNPKGFAGTKRWYLENLEKREKIHLCEKCRMQVAVQELFDSFDRSHFHQRA
jgi:hypothetical protein